jgi:pimeloyl-ACP methyl ester carboxylesterase
MGNTQSLDVDLSTSTPKASTSSTPTAIASSTPLPPPPHPALSRSVPVSALISAATAAPTPPRVPPPNVVPPLSIERTEAAVSSVAQSPRTPGFLDNIRQGYENIILALVRPTRAIYTEREHLGPINFRETASGRSITRYDFLITNRRKQSLVCSHWRFDETQLGGTAPANCVIYCHGNSSCRVSAIGDCLFPCLNKGASVFAFDFSGSGRSDGDFISLGVNESDDIEDVIAHLRREKQASRIVLWGRSMGATSALLYAARDQTLAGVIADSPFSDLNRLCYELVEVGSASLQINLTIMQMLFSLVIRLVRSSTKEKTGVDIFDPKYRAIEAVKGSLIPVLFVAGDRDKLISVKHTQDLFGSYGTNAPRLVGTPADVTKYIHVIKGGDHNEARPQLFVNEAIVFLDCLFKGKALPPELKKTTDDTYTEDSEEDLQLAIERSLQIS